MKYKEIKIELEDFPERLNRTICVKDDISLIKLGVVIGVTIWADFSHFFVFIKDKKIYVPKCMMDEDDDINNQLMADYDIKELGDKFIYEYDMGESYRFICTVEDIDYVDMHDEVCVVTEAKGAGIFEDNKYTFEEYLDGNIPPTTKKDNEDKGIFMPFNLDLKSFGDFDKPVNLKILNENVTDDVEMIFEDIEGEYITGNPFEGAWNNEDDEAFIECRDELRYCYEKLGELMEGLDDLKETMENKYGKEKGREVMKAVVMTNLMGLLYGDEEE